MGTRHIPKLIICSCAGVASLAFAQPECGWSNAPAAPGLDGPITAMVAHDDGSGPALYLGGEFTQIGGSPVRYIARWDGSTWEQVGAGLDAGINDLIVYDWGEGPRLIASGTLYLLEQTTLVYWDGQAWRPVPGTPHAWSGWMGVSSVTGVSELYVGMPVTGYIRRWDGSTWREVGGGLFTVPEDFAEYDGGGGVALFAAGGLAALYKFDGVDWTAIGGDFSINGVVRSLATFDDGSGDALYLGGQFNHVPNTTAINIARWDGQDWAQVGDGFDHEVTSLAVFDDGSGPALYAAGSFTHSGTTALSRIARWEGQDWAPVGTGLDDEAGELVSIPSPGMGDLPGGVYVAGSFAHAGGLESPAVALWGGCVCPADFNGDGDVNTLDVLSFLNAWSAGDPSADFNGDGAVNTLDVLAFLNEWNAGC